MQLIANIVVLGAVYALIACGYVLVYRVSRVLNLAHGELMMLGAYFLLATASLFGGDPVIAVILALVLALINGLVVYLVLMRRMTGERIFAAVLVTIALGILLRGVITLVWTDRLQHPMADLGLENPGVPIFGEVTVSAVALLLIGVTAVVYVALFAFFRFSRWGIRMRAVGESPLLAAQRGIQLHLIYALAWGMATFTAGMAGMLLAADSGLDGTMAIIGLKAFPAALVGGLDSLVGALVGALIVAASEVFAIHYISPLMSDVVPFIVMIVMLLFRPWGLFGTREELERV